MENIPEDKYNHIWYIFVLFGIGILLPWNAVLTALDFFIISYPNYNPAFVFGLTLNAPNFAFNFVTIFFAKYISQTLRIVSSLVVIFACTWAMPIVAEYTDGSTSWVLILIVIVVMGIASAFSQGGLFGFASMFPGQYTGAVMLGNGLSGLSMNVLRMITLAAFPPAEEGDKSNNKDFIGSMIYFAIASLIVICCIFGFFYVLKTPFAHYYIKQAGSQVNDRTRSAEIAARAAGSIGNPGLMSDNLAHNDEDNHIDTGVNSDHHFVHESGILDVYKKIGFMAVQVFLCFTITFVVFPGTSLSTKFDFLGTNEATANKRGAWFSVIMITIFNVFDTIGRFLPAKIQLFTPNTVFALSISRLIFIPLCVLIQLSSSPSGIFQSDWFRIMNMAVFAITNGYASTLLMMFGPSMVEDHELERTGIIMGTHLVGGIFFGSVIASFAMVEIG
jgi:equilibrative nucleoside transporter 1/2/3